MSLPVVMTSAGITPALPADIRAQIVTLATISSPGLTTDLPGTLIEDICSTDVAAVALIDQAQVDLVNSVSPYAANDFILNQLGQVYGVQRGIGYNTSVYVVFAGTPGFVIGKGVIVSDGTYQYVTQDATVINSDGISATVYCVATVAGSWAVPSNSVRNIASSIPSGVTVTVSNPTPGIPSTTAQASEDYRAQVLGAGLVACAGNTQAIKTALQKVPGVVQSLISIRLNPYYAPVSKWEIIVGGGDPFAVAEAIYSSCGDTSSLCGSVMQVSGITSDADGIVTTNLVHGFADGDTVYITGVLGMTGINGLPLTVELISGDPYSFKVGPTSGYGTYLSGGVVSTSDTTITIPRNQEITIFDSPDSYVIPFVLPIQQPTSIEITWNTTSTTVVSADAIAALATAPIQAYVNGLGPGQAINFYELQYIFQDSIVSILPTPLLTYISIAATINGVMVAPAPGTGIVSGDPEGYYYVAPANVTYVQG